MKNDIRNKNPFAWVAFLAAMILQACTGNQGSDEIRQQVLDLHDTLMNVAGKSIDTKIQLDTLSLTGLKQKDPQADTLKERLKIKKVVSQLDTLDDKMQNWMHAFNGEFKGKTDEEVKAYYQNEKNRILTIDSQYRRAIIFSENYLKDLQGRSNNN